MRAQQPPAKRPSASTMQSSESARMMPRVRLEPIVVLMHHANMMVA